jgi:hypothetical protein
MASGYLRSASSTLTALSSTDCHDIVQSGLCNMPRDIAMMNAYGAKELIGSCWFGLKGAL